MSKPIKGPKRNLVTIFIEPFKQLKLGLYVIVVSLAFVVLMAFVFLNAFYEQYQHIMDVFQVVDSNQKWEMITNEVFYKNAIRIGLLLISFIAVIFAVVFRLTHKYYGPLISIGRFVEGIVKGDYSQRVVIRQNDELQDLAKQLNQMAEALQKKHGVPFDHISRNKAKR